MTDSRDVIRTIWADFARGGLEPVLRWFSADFEWVMPDGAVISGHEGLRTYFGGLEQQGVEVRVTPYEFIGEGARVVVPSSLRFRGERSINDEQAFLVYEVQDGLVTRCTWFRDRVAALAYGREA